MKQETPETIVLSRDFVGYDKLLLPKGKFCIVNDSDTVCHIGVSSVDLGEIDSTAYKNPPNTPKGTKDDQLPLLYFDISPGGFVTTRPKGQDRDNEAPGRDKRDKLFIIAGNYRQAERWAFHRCSKRSDWTYVSSVWHLRGLAKGFRCALIGTYYERPDWSEIWRMLIDREAYIDTKWPGLQVEVYGGWSTREWVELEMPAFVMMGHSGVKYGPPTTIMCQVEKV